MNIGRAKITPAIMEGETLMINPHQMEHCSVKVMDVNLAIDNVPAEVIRSTATMPQNARIRLIETVP